MAGQLLPIRLLSTATIFRSSPPSSLSLIFTKLSPKNSPFSSNQCRLIHNRQYSGGRPFSSRPSIVSAKSKSLIEDEAELSDWISDLKSDSFGKQETMDGDRNLLASKERGRNSRSSSLRRRVESDDDVDDFGGGMGNGRGNRPGGSSDFRKRVGDRFGASSDSRKRFDDAGGFGGRIGNGRGNRPGDSSGLRKRFDDGKVGNGRGNRPGDSSGLRKRFDDGKIGNGRGNRPGDSLGSRKRFDDGKTGTGRGNRPGDSLGGSRKRFDDGKIENGRGNRPGDSLGSRKRFDDGKIGNGRGNRSVDSLDSRKRVDDQFGVSSAFNKRGRGDFEGGGRVGQHKRSQGLVVSSSEDEDEDEDEDEEEEESDDVMSDFDNDFFGDKEDRKERVTKGASEKGSSVLSNDGDIVKAIPRISVPASDSYLSESRFDQFPLSPLSLKGLKAIGYERMTVVQEATLSVILNGKDVLAKAKTGTGKTVAFLLPAIEIVAKLPSPDRDNRRPPINVLVMCPTRELADQAAMEASKLLKYHASIGVQVVMGGTRLALEQKRMQANPCQILVATPGRLRDHMENTPGFTSRLAGVKVLVLDEADRLLDMGFRKDIEKIVAELPKQRQTLLFSATVSDEVRQICYIAMKRDNEFINTVGEGSEETHTQVMQTHLIAPLDKQFSILYGILTDHIAEDVDYKVILFCTTAMVTRLVADLLAELNLNIREMHSRKPQSYRTRVSKEFRESKGLILVSSDVSARGVDYPDVTLVIQLGVPADREQYIHRLGRTGRKGKEGKGILLLAPWEDFFLGNVRDLPITETQVPLIDPDTRKKVERALAHVEMKNKESAYQAWLGYYNSIKNVAREKSKLAVLANEFSRSMGLDNPPAVSTIVLRKMGLNNVPGIRAK